MNTKANEIETQINKNILSGRNKTMKTTKVLIALTLAIFLTFCSILPVFAAVVPVLDTEGNPTGAYRVENETDVLAAVIAKRLKTAVGTSTPATTFTFTATPYSFDGVTADAAAKLPMIGPNKNNIITIDYPAGNHPGEVVIEGTDTVKYVYRESADIFGGITFDRAGEYTWRIKEQTGPFVNSSTEQMIYNTTTEYEITAHVQQKADGSGYYIWAIGAKIVVLDEGNKSGAAVGQKVDPQPGNPDEKNSWKHSGMVFTNKYIKKGEMPPDPKTGKSSLSVLKRVAGSFRDENAYFNYSMTFKKNAVVPADNENALRNSFIAYILETDSGGTNTSIVTGNVLLTNNKISGTGVTVDTTTGQPASGVITIPYTVTDFTFSLKANQTIAFFEMYVGTNYTITELSPTNYVPAAEIKYYDKKSVYRTFSDSAGMSANLAAVNDKDGTDPSLFFIGEPELNTVKFTNTRDSVTPTGLNINDLPFIGMIVLAIAGVTGYVGYKLFKNSRKRKAFILDCSQ